jgi:iron(II)-dependent oxidoreductase
MLKLFSKRKKKPTGSGPVQKTAAPPADQYKPAPPVAPLEDALAQALLAGRFGAVAAGQGQWLTDPGFAAARGEAIEAIDELFGLVPEGFASIPMTVNDQPGCAEQDFAVDPFLMQRFCVSNAQYQMFVDDGAYENLELWPEEIWPHLIDFKDLTGETGPRYWRGGRHDQTLASHPVVGVCYHEAEAYALWAGFRLPAEPEWQMAASWRIRNGATAGRRYPWGDALELSHCNIWSCGHGEVLPVDACPGGAAPNGVVQLVGNVWEWTATDFDCTDDHDRPIVGDMELKAIRGGAYDTYFPWQANSLFRSGLTTLSRAHNVGIRCAMDLPTSDDGNEFEE